MRRGRWRASEPETTGTGVWIDERDGSDSGGMRIKMVTETIGGDG